MTVLLRCQAYRARVVGDEIDESLVLHTSLVGTSWIDTGELTGSYSALPNSGRG